mgnify:CR=1 FL=1
MNRDNQPWWPVAAAEIQWSERGAPYSRQFDDVYYSREDGLAESEHVFLAGNRLPERWSHCADGSFRIGETGFGTGLNFLLTWQRWRELPPPRPRLHYLSIEKHPLTREDLARAHGHWTALAGVAEELRAAWPGLVPGQHRLVLEGGALILDLWWEDVREALPDLASHGPCIDAWYLDGFAPARNESMWQQPLFDAVAALSRPGASFATFTAAGQVRRGLAQAGFEAHKMPGFGRKRESLRGELVRPATAVEPKVTPWDLPDAPPPPADSALVIGAGLAGCSTAAALAHRGLSVTLLDAQALAGQASGNEQGILYTRLSRRHSPLTDFALQSFRFAATRYAQLFASGALQRGSDGELCGSYHEHGDPDELALLAGRLVSVPELARVLSPERAEPHLGVLPSRAGFWYPASGWLNPPAVCHAFAGTPGVRFQEHCGEVALQRGKAHWEARGDGELLARASIAIICTGVSTDALPALDWIPRQAIRGQTSHIPGSNVSSALKAVLCHAGYIAPAREGRHCIGATFNLRDEDTTLREADHRHNLDRLAAALPQWRDDIERLDTGALAGRVGFRCASPDYLPIAGPVPDREAFLRTFAQLRKNARQLIADRGPYMSGLYINTAHGSRGLSSTPLVAEWLASLVCGEPAPICRELQRALAPSRFLVRDLARNRI